VIGKDTESCMQSGIYWGYVGLVEGLVGRIKSEFGAPMRTIATGGLAPLFAGATDAIEHVDPDLTLWGLRLIFERNAKRGASPRRPCGTGSPSATPTRSSSCRSAAPARSA